MSTPGPKELATRALGENKRKHRRIKPKLIGYAGKPPHHGLHDPKTAKAAKRKGKPK